MWIEEIHLGDFFLSAPPIDDSVVRVEDSDCVVLSRCVIMHGAPLDRAALSLARSTTFVFDASVLAPAGETMIRVDGGRLEIHGGTFDRFCPNPWEPCGPIAPKLHLVGVDPVVLLQDVPSLTSPSDPQPPLVDSGSYSSSARKSRTHLAASPVYDDSTVEVELRGLAGDLALVSIGTRPALASLVSGVDVPLLLAPLQTDFVGTLSGSTFHYQRSVGDIPPGLFTTLCIQVLFVNAGADERVRSEPTTVTLLDAGERPAEHFFTSEPVAELAPAGNVAFGASVASAGDVNGDGFDDVIVGDPGHEFVPSGFPFGQSFRGLAQVYHGSASGLGSAPAWSREGDVVVQDIAPSGLGHAVGAAGDVNGDGFDDVFATVARTTTAAGHLWVFYGSPSGVSDAGATDIVDGAAYDHCAAGDVNGDGFDDLWQARDMSVRGEGVLRYGSAGGLLSTGWIHAATGNAWVEVESAGDVNGDGFADLLFGTDLSLFDDVGTIALLLGGPVAPTLTWSYTDSGLAVNGFAGAGDYDQDGFDDLVLGAASNRLLVFRGSAAGPASEPDRVLTTPFFKSMDSGLGLVRSLGDVDADGAPELLVSGFSAWDSSREDVWFVLRGSPEGPSASPGWKQHLLARLTTVSSAGDVNGDGRLDLVLGAYDTDLRDGADGGSVKLFTGTP